MPSLVQCIPDFFMAPAYVYLIYVIFSSHLYYNRFYKFFISTGICGVVSVIANIFVSRPLYPPQFFWLFAIFVLLNQWGAIGATIGKFYIVAHRFLLLRGQGANAPDSTIFILIFLQFSIPILIAFPILLFGSTNQSVNRDIYVHTLSDTGNNIQRILNTTIYCLYFIITIVLTAFSAAILSRFSKYAMISRKCLKQQRQLIIVTAVCCFTHLLKAAHQMSWFYLIVSGNCSPAIYNAYILPSYLLVNGLATYSFPIALVVCSRKVRFLLIRRAIPPTHSISTIMTSIQHSTQ